MKSNIFIYISLLLVVLLSTFACSNKNKDAVTFSYDPELIPMMNTDSVTMLISDSGIVRYKVVTKTWEVYDQIADPYWFFPEKLYLEQFDTTFTVTATVNADTAWNYSKKKLWRLKGNVFIKNKEGTTFAGDEVFWDEDKQLVYSDKDVIINRPNKGILRAAGFEANQQMTEYKYFKAKDSEVYVNESPQEEKETTEDIK